jgi:hypothetical protein
MAMRVNCGQPCDWYRSIPIVMTLLLGSAADATADTLTVICGTGGPGAFASISDAIASLPQNSTTEPHTINVTGTCTESVNIVNRQRITIQGQPPAGTATIVAPTANSNVLVANGSRAMTFRRLIIQGGTTGVTANRDSEVTVDSCTIENNSIGVSANQHSLLLVTSGSGPTQVQNNTAIGVFILGASELVVPPSTSLQVQGNHDGVVVTEGSTGLLGNAVVTGNDAAGVFVQSGAQVQTLASAQISNNVLAPNPQDARAGVVVGNRSLFGANGTTISGNRGDGIIVGGELAGNATIRLMGATVSGNSGNGIIASTGAVAGLSGSSITANGLDGIRLIKASIAGLPDAPGTPPLNLPANTINGNGGRGISCDTTARAFGDLSGISGRGSCTN